MELSDSELYWTRRTLGVVTEKETDRYIHKLEKRINELEKIIESKDKS